MSHWRFDVDQFRKNWERATDLPPDEMPAKFAAVEPPRDPYQAARELLARVRVLSSGELERHGPALSPFFDQVEESIRQLEAAADAKQKKAIRAELDKALWDLEDLLGLFGGLQG